MNGIWFPGSPSLPAHPLLPWMACKWAAICVSLMTPGLRAALVRAPPAPFQSEAEVNWLWTRGDGALEVLLFGKPLLQNDPDEFVAFSVTQFSLP